MKYRHDLDAIEGVLVARKRELAEKAGTDEVVTSVQVFQIWVGIIIKQAFII